jgi:RHS repeat-associated protein
MPIAAVIDGVHYAVHADHLNTPRRLTDGAKAVKWQWPYSGFGEIGARATPAAGQATLNYSLRYPGQIDDGNGLFYNWHRFYDPRVGRYTKADPIGLDGGWNRFGYVGGIHWGLWIRRDCNDPLDQAMPGNAALTVDMARNDHLDSHQVMHGKTRQATLVKTVILCA